VTPAPGTSVSDTSDTSAADISVLAPAPDPKDHS